MSNWSLLLKKKRKNSRQKFREVQVIVVRSAQSISCWQALCVILKMNKHHFRTVVLNWGWFCCPRDVWNYPQTFLVATTGGGVRCPWHLVIRDTASLPQHTAPPQRNVNRQQGWVTGLEVSSVLESLENHTLKPLISCGQKSKHPRRMPRVQLLYRWKCLRWKQTFQMSASIA